jgi:LmbE family N-acetylglucosaminyl deacetylase
MATAGISTSEWRSLLRWCSARQGHNPGPPSLLVAAHPDDEVIGAGMRLGHLGTIQLVHVTDGAPRDPSDAERAGQPSRVEYASARRRELLQAMALIGLGPTRLISLGLVDQEAALSMDRLTESLARIISALRPEVVITHPFEGGHPDHDATAFAVHHACELLRRRGEPSSVVIEMTSYHQQSGKLRTGEFLPGGDPGLAVPAAETDVARKQRMLRCYESQGATLAAFGVGPERFRQTPTYDFTAPPHEGAMYYEQFAWGMTVAKWQQLAYQARQSLGFEHPASCGMPETP